MKNYRYKLDKSSKKHNCPQCGKKRFVKYIDEETGQYLPDHYGRCDREDECNYHLNPYKDGYAKMIWKEENNISSNWRPTSPILKYEPKAPTPIYYFDFETFRKTLKDYDKNIFIQNLLHNVPFPFTTDAVTKIIELFRLGTISNNYRTGAITFPFIDINNNVRTIQVKEFDKSNHTKNKGTDFLHSMIERHYKRKGKTPPEWIEKYNKNEMKVSCLFGEHLLKEYPNNPIALVEAPKTAIYGTLYFGSPDNPKNLLWIAVYSKSTFKYDRIKILKGRRIVVFPDLSKDGNTFDLWNNRAKEFQKRMKNTTFKTFDLLERMGTHEQKNEGLDIADILIQHDWRKYKKEQNKIVTGITKVSDETKQLFLPESKVEIGTIKRIKRNNALNITFDDLPFNDVQEQERDSKELDDWTKEIEDLKIFFSSTSIKPPIHLQQGVTITNITDFVNSHLPIVENYNGKRVGFPYLDRLRKVKDLTINPRLPIDKVSTIFKPQNNYYKADILDKISIEQLNDLIEKKLITQTSVGTYYLTSSTPF